jgi:hypothetical protein
LLGAGSPSVRHGRFGAGDGGEGLSGGGLFFVEVFIGMGIAVDARGTFRHFVGHSRGRLRRNREHADENRRC